jgi:hypothetical protein
MKSQAKPALAILTTLVALVVASAVIKNHRTSPSARDRTCFSLAELTSYLRDSTELEPLHYVNDGFFTLMTRDSSAVLNFIGDSSCIRRINGYFKYGDLLDPRERARNLAIRNRLFINAVDKDTSYQKTMQTATKFAFDNKGVAYEKSFRDVAFTLTFRDADSMVVMSFFRTKDRLSYRE